MNVLFPISTTNKVSSRSPALRDALEFDQNGNAKSLGRREPNPPSNKKAQIYRWLSTPLYGDRLVNLVIKDLLW
jgi:hypothetical protein